MNLWLTGLGDGDFEFGKKPLKELSKIVLDKSSLWPNNIVVKFQGRLEDWDGQQWLA